MSYNSRRLFGSPIVDTVDTHKTNILVLLFAKPLGGHSHQISLMISLFGVKNFSRERNLILNKSRLLKKSAEKRVLYINITPKDTTPRIDNPNRSDNHFIQIFRLLLNPPAARLGQEEDDGDEGAALVHHGVEVQGRGLRVLRAQRPLDVVRRQAHRNNQNTGYKRVRLGLWVEFRTG